MAFVEERGKMGLLDELRAAQRIGHLDDARLPEPSLEFGAPADLAVFRKPVLEATADDVALVMVGGAIRIHNC